MKSLLTIIAAVACLGGFAVVTPAAAAPKVAVCTITSHPVGCVQPDPIWVHGSTLTGPVDRPCGERSPRRD